MQGRAGKGEKGKDEWLNTLRNRADPESTIAKGTDASDRVTVENTAWNGPTHMALFNSWILASQTQQGHPGGLGKAG